MKKFTEEPTEFIECKVPVDCCDTVAGLINPTADLTITIGNGGDSLSLVYLAKHDCGIKRHSIKIEILDPTTNTRWVTQHHFVYDPVMDNPEMHLNWGDGAAALAGLPENLIGKIVKVRLHIISKCNTSVIVEQRYALV